MKIRIVAVIVGLLLFACLTNVADALSWKVGGNTKMILDAAGNLSVVDNVSATYFCLNNVCINSWPSSGFSSVGDNYLYNSSATLYFNSTFLVAAIGNWTAEKGSYLTSVQLDNSSVIRVGNSSWVSFSVGNWSADKASYSVGAFNATGDAYLYNSSSILYFNTTAGDARYQAVSQKNAANGYAGLDESSLVSRAQLPEPNETDFGGGLQLSCDSGNYGAGVNSSGAPVCSDAALDLYYSSGNAITSTSTAGGYAVQGNALNSEGIGVYGWGNLSAGTSYGVSGAGFIGVYGNCSPDSGAYGVYALNSLASSSSLYGQGSLDTGEGIHARGNYQGIYASSSSNSGYGVFGSIFSPTGAGYGVRGFGLNSSGFGVYGVGNSTSGRGVYGSGYYGVYGNGAYGIYGTNGSAGNGSYFSSSSGAGVYAESTTGNAGEFSGNVSVSGNVTASYLCIGADCRNSWPAGRFTDSGDNFTYNSSGVLYFNTTGADSHYQVLTGKNASNGYAGLDESSLVSRAQLPTPNSTALGGVLNYTCGSGSWVSGINESGSPVCSTVTAVTTLNGLSEASQSFVNDSNLGVSSGGSSHSLVWLGTLADERIASAATWSAKSSVVVNEFNSTSAGPWSKPAGATVVTVICVGGGGGGAGGRTAATNVIRTGGGGGGGGSVTMATFNASVLASSVAITIGAGGAGGSCTGNTCTPTAGGNGATSAFGTYLYCHGGGGGPGGGTTAAVAGGGGASVLANASGATGGAPASTVTASIGGQGATAASNVRMNSEWGGATGAYTSIGAAPLGGGRGLYGCSGGGAGGSLTAANGALSPSAGGAGGPPGVAYFGGGGAAGTSGATGTNGTAGSSTALPYCGAGGGGGGSSTSAGVMGGYGGAGGPGAGGGGGGAGSNSPGAITGAVGGAGGAGRVIVISE